MNNIEMTRSQIISYLMRTGLFTWESLEETSNIELIELIKSAIESQGVKYVPIVIKEISD